MKTTIPLYICASQYEWQDKTEFCAFSFDAGKDDAHYVTVSSSTLDIEVPDDFDVRPGRIAALEAQKKKATADYQALMNTLDGKIQSLRCIEHKPDLTNNETRGE